MTPDCAGGLVQSGDFTSIRVGIRIAGHMILSLLDIPGASHFHQHQLLVVADIKRAERAS